MFSRRFACVALVVCAFAGFAAAQGTETSETEVLGAERSASSTPPPSAPLEQPLDPDKYICGPGDVFELNFWGQQNFRLRISVDLEGRTFISKVGFVIAAGKTLSAVRAQVRQKVRGTYPGLQFELTLASPRAFLVHVVGNVKSPGLYTTNALERLSSVVARADTGAVVGHADAATVREGVSRGSRRRIEIRHRDGSVATGDLISYELMGRTDDNPQLLDGDVITIPAAALSATITGAVLRPGKYELVGKRDLAELLQLAGGYTSSVSTEVPLRVLRRNEKQQKTTEIVTTKTSATAVTLNDGDEVIVPDVDELQRSVLLIGAVAGAESVDAEATTRRLPYVNGDTVGSLIDRAGGIKAPGDLRRAYISRPRPDGPPEIKAVDLEALLVRRDFHADVPISMGDTIVVPPMRYSITVEGAVSRPGIYNYNPLFGVAEYVARAGGRTRLAKDLSDARVVNGDGELKKLSSKDRLQPGDAVVVPERNWSRSEVVQLFFASAGLALSMVAVGLALR